MLALLTYPFAVEPNLTSHNQAVVWSGGFVCFAVICTITAWKTSAGKSIVHPDYDSKVEPAPAIATRLIWLGLSASASVLLLTVTTHLTQDVAAIPFLWIVPLAIYLLSFIICFESPRIYFRPVFLPFFLASLAFMAYRLWRGHQRIDLRLVIALFALGLFNCCMVCHGELVRLKPRPRYLTGFYVTISLGGAMGGLFVGLVAPNLFRAYYEFPIGLILCALVTCIVFSLAIWRSGYHARQALIGVLVLAVGGYAYILGTIMFDMVSGYQLARRNFYGQLRVYQESDPRLDDLAFRRLVHGTINHGEQLLSEAGRRRPVTYFCPQSGIGRGMQAQEGSPRRIGILGLGCGTLAAYGRAGDTLRIYEINPQVLEIANRNFTYIKDTPAKVEVALGDGRLLLDSEPSQHFDMLVMDAFSGDSVPVHLITREAFRTYFRHLKPDGILAVNISNTYLDLEPVMERAANAFGKVALVYRFAPDDGDQNCFSCTWTLIMDQATADSHPALMQNVKILKPERPFRIWTDDFSNMFSILK
jgi:hypothetical protein